MAYTQLNLLITALIKMYLWSNKCFVQYLLSHIVDLVRWLTSKETAEAFAVGSNLFSNLDTGKRVKRRPDWECFV